MDGNFLVSFNTEGSDGVSSFGGNWGLTSQIFNNFGSFGKFIS
jgi:hypothetical protein